MKYKQQCTKDQVTRTVMCLMILRDFRVRDHSDSSLVKSSRRRSIQEIRFLNIANIQIYNNQSEITMAPSHIMIMSKGWSEGRGRLCEGGGGAKQGSDWRSQREQRWIPESAKVGHFWSSANPLCS